MYDGLFFLTNDVKTLEQGQSVIIARLDRLDIKVYRYIVRALSEAYNRPIF